MVHQNLLPFLLRQRINMNWKEKLKILDQKKEWDAAIEFMEHVIEQNPDDMDVYIALNYFFMNLITEEDYSNSKFHDYTNLARHYFDESYERFSENAEYLFFSAATMAIADWYMDIGMDRVHEMFKRALSLEPNNLLYQWGVAGIGLKYPDNIKAGNVCAKKVLENSSIVAFLKSKGAMGEYLLTIQLKPCDEES